MLGIHPLAGHSASRWSRRRRSFSMAITQSSSSRLCCHRRLRWYIGASTPHADDVRAGASGTEEIGRLGCRLLTHTTISRCPPHVQQQQQRQQHQQAASSGPLLTSRCRSAKTLRPTTLIRLRAMPVCLSSPGRELRHHGCQPASMHGSARQF